MDRKEERRDGRGGDHHGVRCRWGSRAQQTPGDEVNDRRVCRVEHDACEVITRRSHAPHRVVEAERQPGDGDPVGEMRAGEHPREMRPAETSIPAIRNEVEVVVPDVAVRYRGQKHQTGDDRHGERRKPWARCQRDCHDTTPERAYGRPGLLLDGRDYHSTTNAGATSSASAGATERATARSRSAPWMSPVARYANPRFSRKTASLPRAGRSSAARDRWSTASAGRSRFRRY